MPIQPEDLMIRRAREADLPEMARLHQAAFPGAGMSLDETIAHLRDDPRLALEDHWVCWQGSRIVGIFSLFRFNLFRAGNLVPVGGIGSVAVAPEARRMKVAFRMMQRAVEIMEQNAVPLSILHPFRHKFYRRLGWGLVGKIIYHRLAPPALPLYAERQGVAPVLTAAEREEVMRCYLAFARARNGLLERSDAVWNERIFRNCQCQAYREPGSGEVTGYLTYIYRPLPAEKDFLTTELVVREFVWLNGRALRGLLGFLAGQSDQVSAVELPLQAGPALENALSDPRMPDGRQTWLLGAETAWLGSGLMGRIVNLRRAMSAWGYPVPDSRVTLAIRDELNPANASPVTVEFAGGRVQFCKESIAAPVLETDMATFSSLYWGALALEEAVELGLAEVKGQGEEVFHEMFAVPRPVCLDYF